MSPLSRRELLRIGGLSAFAFASLDTLTACGSSSSGAATTDASALKSFVADTSSGKPTSLPGRVAWASTADSEFFNALGAGMRQAAARRNVQYLTAVSGNDPRKHAQQMSAFVSQAGSFAMQPLNADADTPVLQKAIDAGLCTQAIITAPSTLQVAASQYRIGYDQGKAAADYVNAHLGGSARAIYFNLDTASSALRERHRGVLAGLRTGGGGIDLVADLTVADISTKAGFNTMMSALQAHRDIKVVLGGDTIVVGAYQALRESGRLRDDMFLSGVDGDRQALDLIKQGGAYKLSIGFAWKLMGYGLGQFGADWIEGKQVPRVMVANGIRLDSPAAVATFEAANADPSAVFADRSKYETYLPLYGNVSHSTRGTYWTAAVDPPKR